MVAETLYVCDFKTIVNMILQIISACLLLIVGNKPQCWVTSYGKGSWAASQSWDKVAESDLFTTLFSQTQFPDRSIPRGTEIHQ
jgi:hypothetical protein